MFTIDPSILHTIREIVLNEQTGSAEEILAALPYQPTRKKPLRYKFVDLSKTERAQMPAMSYGVNPQSGVQVVTVLPDGKETTNVAESGDIIMSGASREQYVIKAAKFPKLYTGTIGSPVTPEQSPRMVARYTGTEPVTFQASWGEQMVLKPGDYVVREADGKNYYRIAKAEFERTYQPVK